MKKIAVFLCLFLFLSAAVVHAASTRNMCKQFFPNWNLSQCITRQEAAASQMVEWASNPASRFSRWAEACTNQNLIAYGVTNYVNYNGAEKCVRQLYQQYERERTERMKAEMTYDRGRQEGYREGQRDAATGIIKY